MKAIYTLLLIGFAMFSISAIQNNKPGGEPEKIKWYTWDEAVALQAKKPKKVFVDVYTDWCGWCKRMDANTFTNAELAAYMNKNFYPVKFNAEQREMIEFKGTKFEFKAQGNKGVHELASELLNGKLGYPSFVMLDEKFSRIAISPGYKEAPQMLKELKFAGENIYKNTDWATYSTM
ncbi:MAG: DUF255 domain-containing protein [Saprospiraceae bacterium]